METSFGYCDRETAWFSSDERRWITKIRRLAEKFPDQVRIIKQPEENDGCIYACLPSRAMKINLISPRQMTDEQRAIAGERLKSARKSLKETEVTGDA